MLGLGTKLTSSSGLGDLRRDYNFLKGFLHSDIDFSRDSNATQTGSDGYIKFAPNNLLPYSEAFNLSDWVKYNVDASASAITDPFGGTGSYFVKQTSSASNTKLILDSHAVVNGGTYIFSVYAKAKEISVLQLILGNVTMAGGNNHANFDLTNGAVTATGGGCVAKIEKIGTDGWYRCSLADTTSASGNIQPTFSLCVSPTASRANSFTGTVNDGLYMFGAMSEQTFDKNSSPSAYLKSSGGAEHAPRFDYDKDGNSKGLLIEEARTQYVTHSIDLNSGLPNKGTGVTIATAGDIQDPSGAYETRKLVQSPSGNGNIYQSAFNAISTHFTNGSVHTRSIFAKKAEMSFIKIQHYDGTDNLGAYFDLDKGILGTVNTGVTAKIEDYGNGWYRCSVTRLTPAGRNDAERLQVGLATGDNASMIYTGDGLSGVYLAFGQLEIGAFPSSFIPSYGASTTVRAADVASVSGTAFDGFFKDTEGTIVADVQLPKGWEDTNFNRFYSFHNGSNTNRITAWLNAASGQEPRGQIISGGSDQGSLIAKNIKLNTGEVARLGQSYKANSHYVTLDASSGAEDTDTLPTGLNALNIGSDNYGSGTVSVFGGWIRRLRYFNKKKSNTQVQKLTDSDKILQKFKGAKAAHSLRALTDFDKSPVTRIRREYDSFEADYTAAQVSNGELENDFKSEKQTTLPLDVSVEADEMVTNGGFTTDSDWTTTNATINTTSNRAELDSSSDASSILQDVLVKSKKYTLTFTVDSYVANGGSANVFNHDGTTIQSITANGGYSVTFTQAIANGNMSFFAQNGVVYNVSNISVKEVNPIGTGFSTRLINADYKGKPLMRIRRQDNTEAELYADGNDEISLSSSIKGSSQNLLGFSEDFGEWTLDSDLSRASGVADPFGGNNAWTLTSSGTNQKCLLNANLSAGQHTYSVYIRRRTGTGDIRLVNYLGTQVVTVTNEWTRVSRTDNYLGNTHFSIRVDTNGDEIDVFGAQLEQTVYASSGSNILYNGDFELDTSWNDFGSPVTQTQSTEQVRSGTYSRKVTSTASGKGTQSAQGGSNGLDLTAGNKYRISAWIYAVDGGGSANIQSGLGNTDQSVFTSRAVTEGQWTNITYDAIATASGGVATYLSFFTSGDTKTFYVDDVTVTELPKESPSTYSQTPVIVSTHHSTDATTLGEFSGLENLIIRSTYTSGQSGTSWNAGSTLSEASSTETSPTGSQDAFKLLETATTQEHALVDYMQMQPSQTYVFSTYIKSVNGGNVKLFTWQRNSSNTMIDVFFAAFDLTNGTVISDQTSTGLESSISDEGNDWYRISMKFTTSANVDTSGSYLGAVRINVAQTNGSHSAYAGDTTKGIIQWGSQLNTNSLKTFQATTGTALTGDVNVVNWYDQAGGEDFTQNTADNQPRIVMGGELVTDSGGKASVYFDGNDNLINSNLAGQNRLDSYIVIEPDLAADDSQVLLSGNDSAKYGLIFDDDNSSQTINNGFGTPSEFINGVELAANATRNDVHDGLQNFSLFSITGGTTSSFTTFQMGWNNSAGSSLNYQGKLSEMVFFPNMDSSPKRFPIEQNMMNHFDVGLMDIDFEDGISEIGKSGTSTIGDAVLSAETTNPISGTQSLKVAITGGNNSSYPRLYTTSTGSMSEDAEIGTKYRVTFDTKLISGTVTLKGLGFADGGNAAKGFLNTHNDSDNVVLSGSQSHSFENTITELTSSVGHRNDLFFSFKGTEGDGVFLIDNIKIKKLGVTGYVTKLYDQTGNNCHAVQDTAANQPQIVSGGDLIKSGGHPAWDFITGAPQRSLTIHGLTGITDLDAFFVHDANDTKFIYPSSGAGSYFGFPAFDEQTSATNLSSAYGNPVLEVNGSEPTQNNQDAVYEAIKGRKLVYHRSALTIGWPSVNIGFTFGSNNSWNLEDVKFSEMIWYDSDQHGNQSGIESNINSHYNIYS